ncbi:hypothetical protein BDV39DRAFT_118203 [Aspergillus sergii]|uniref:Uncharacterized protein n=1 Tax=Aspergillus sergii TaxID=1034303 RepID=A0A5N6WX44_9EURO|nr:hypothetical protein BDV39DRAFT_118203 [Aspergillus sergii]
MFWKMLPQESHQDYVLNLRRCHPRAGTFYLQSSRLSSIPTYNLQPAIFFTAYPSESTVGYDNIFLFNPPTTLQETKERRTISPLALQVTSNKKRSLALPANLRDIHQSNFNRVHYEQSHPGSPTSHPSTTNSGADNLLYKGKFSLAGWPFIEYQNSPPQFHDPDYSGSHCVINSTPTICHCMMKFGPRLFYPCCSSPD